MSSLLSIWTIYDRPRDVPHAFIARRFVVGLGRQVCATDETMTERDIETLRKYFRAAGLHRLPRQEADDAVIVESWL